VKKGKKLSKRCTWCKQWEVYECGYSHSGMFGALNCSECNNTNVICASDSHPSNKSRWQV
jgi:hypothetical protein